MKIKTTTPQKIALAIFKANNLNLFKGSLNAKEEAFISVFRTSRYFGNLTIEESSDGRFVLMWDSIAKITVACRITDSKFVFTELGLYDKEKKQMGYPVSVYWMNHPNTKHQVRLENEIKDIKNLFLNYVETGVLVSK